MRLDHNYRSDLHILPHSLAYYILKTLVSTPHKCRQELPLMSIPMENDPQLLRNRQDNVPVPHTRLQYTTHLRPLNAAYQPPRYDLGCMRLLAIFVSLVSSRKHRDTILLPFAVAHEDLSVANKIHVFHSKPNALHQSQSGPIKDITHDSFLAPESIEQGPLFLPGSKRPEGSWVSLPIRPLQCLRGPYEAPPCRE